MKDRFDKKTIDGFGDLLKELDEHPPADAQTPRQGIAFSDLAQYIDHVAKQNGITLKRPVGRPPEGEKALTPAEKQKAYRDRQRAQKQAEAARLAALKNGEPVTSSIIDLNTDFADLIRQKP